MDLEPRHDLCFDRKRPYFRWLVVQNRGHSGSRDVYMGLRVRKPTGRHSRCQGIRDRPFKIGSPAELYRPSDRRLLAAPALLHVGLSGASFKSGGRNAAHSLTFFLPLHSVHGSPACSGASTPTRADSVTGSVRLAGPFDVRGCTSARSHPWHQRAAWPRPMANPKRTG